jgi:hypothetical protein
MSLISTTKQGYEKYFIHGDFSTVMDLEEEILSHTTTVLDKDGVDVSADIIDVVSPFVEGKKQFIRIQGGEQIKSPYKITIRIETSTGNRWEVDGLIKVKEL